jgi:hypothetical protein
MENPCERGLEAPSLEWSDMVWVDLAQDMHQWRILVNEAPSLGWSGMVWVDLAQDMHQWRILVNAVLKLL